MVVHALGAVISRHNVYDIHDVYARSSCSTPVVFLLPQTSTMNCRQSAELSSTAG